jgi:hypothetical protein
VFTRPFPKIWFQKPNFGKGKQKGKGKGNKRETKGKQKGSQRKSKWVKKQVFFKKIENQFFKGNLIMTNKKNFKSFAFLSKKRKPNLVSSTKKMVQEKKIFLKIQSSKHVLTRSSPQNLSEKGAEIVSSEKSKEIFFNVCFDKNHLKTLIAWFLEHYGQKKTLDLVETLKRAGFHQATLAGVSLGLDDLKIPPQKGVLVTQASENLKKAKQAIEAGKVTNVEKSQQLIDTWNQTSEGLRQAAVSNFRMTNPVNPVYMMAFSGARGNISQVRQLVAMRGLMADPQGAILEFPIQSNFREGLTVTEYLLSCYGARKGLVDTALRTATSGYLTRRLVDAVQHVVVTVTDCQTQKGILLKKKNLEQRLLGRVLLKELDLDAKTRLPKNTLISQGLAKQIALKHQEVRVRSPLTCQTEKSVCQLCYGLDLSQGKLVNIGEAVGIIAAQSIGEPGTQLTMRTFHTGGVGVFSDQAMKPFTAPFQGKVEFLESLPGRLVRTPHGSIVYLLKHKAFDQTKPLLRLTGLSDFSKSEIYEIPSSEIPAGSLLWIKQGETVKAGQLLLQASRLQTKKQKMPESTQPVPAPLSGEVFFEKITLRTEERFIRKGKQFIKEITPVIPTVAKKLGRFWVFSCSYQKENQSVPSFFKKGDLISPDTPIQEFQFHILEKGQLQNLGSSLVFGSRKIEFLVSKIYYARSFYFLVATNKPQTVLAYKKKSKTPFLSWYPRFHNFPSKLAGYCFFVDSFSFWRRDEVLKGKNSLVFFIFSYKQTNLISKLSANDPVPCLSLSQNLVEKPNFGTTKLVSKFSGNTEFGQGKGTSVFVQNFDLPKNKFFIPKIGDPILGKRRVNTILRKGRLRFFGSQPNQIFSSCFLFPKGSIFSVNGLFQFVPHSKSLPSRKTTGGHNFIKNQHFCFPLVKFGKSKEIEKQKTHVSQFLQKSSQNLVFKTKFWERENSDQQVLKFQNHHAQFIQKKHFWFCVPKNQGANRLFSNLAGVLLEPGKQFQNLTFERCSVSVNLLQTREILLVTSKSRPNFTQKLDKKTSFTFPCQNSVETLNFDTKEVVPKFGLKTKFWERETKTPQKTKFWEREGPTSRIFGFSSLQEIVNKNQNWKFKPFLKSKTCQLLAMNSLETKKSQKNFFVRSEITKFCFYQNPGGFSVKSLRFSLKPKQPFRQTLVFQKLYQQQLPEKRVLKENWIHQEKSPFFQNGSISSPLFTKQKKTHFSWNLSKKRKVLSSPFQFLIPSTSGWFSGKSFLKVEIQYQTLFGKVEKFEQQVIPMHKHLDSGVPVPGFSIFFYRKIDLQNNFHLRFQTFDNGWILPDFPVTQAFLKSNHLGEFRGGLRKPSFFRRKEKEKNSFLWSVLGKQDLSVLEFPLLENQQKLFQVSIGKRLRWGHEILPSYGISVSGQIVKFTEKTVTFRKGTPFLAPLRGLVHISQGDVVTKNDLLITLRSRRLQTEDIVQGIPKIEQLFEARETQGGELLQNNMHMLLSKFFHRTRKLKPINQAAGISLLYIQNFLVSNIVEAYSNQGVHIAEKHVEVVVRQMTARVRIVDGGQTGFLQGELVQLRFIEKLNKKIEEYGWRQARYEPIILGITKSVLQSESFLLAASFQQVSKVLVRSALAKKTDFLRGLHENILVGKPITAGTGVQPSFINSSFRNENENSDTENAVLENGNPESEKSGLNNLSTNTME